ncbi:hypothetical protein DL95DRAFT_468550 [Leptodontidium sp. 2 PMI_412]|nr:hypothetical protein DL95DRAFT_468550 [Leptodontidium sp. 2 PMI_412]
MAGSARASDVLEIKSQPWRVVWPASKGVVSKNDAPSQGGHGNLNGQNGVDNEGKGVAPMKGGEGNLNGQHGYDNEGRGLAPAKGGEGNLNGQHGYNDKGEGISSRK